MENLKDNLSLFLKNNKKQIVFYLVLNCIIVFCITLSSYVHIPLSGIKDRLLYFIHILLLQFSLVGYIYLITLNKWLFRFIFIPLFFIFSMFSYWVYSQDISITNTLIRVVLETKSSIVIDLISFQYIFYFLFVLIVIVVINKWYNKVGKIKNNVAFLVISMCSILSFTFIENKRINTLKSRIPYSVFFGFKEYLKKDNIVLNEVPSRVHSLVDNLNVVLVAGESVRADHLQINGYKRKTTPLLSKMDNLVSFPYIYTPHTYTSISLPRILSDAEVKTEDISKLTSLFDVFNACEYNTVWIGNQEMERSYEPLVRANKQVILVDSLRSVFSFSKSLDELLLVPFDKVLLEKRSEELITLHMIGSHWWYENRYSNDFRIFKPVIDSKHVPSSTSEQLINSYDNTIVYLDNFLNDVIKKQKALKKPSLLVYIADHGESLGEDGKWLHGQDVEASKNPAMLVWFSDEFQQAYPNQVNALYKNQNRFYSTDIIYHSLLDVIDVNGIEFNIKKSIFKDSL